VRFTRERDECVEDDEQPDQGCEIAPDAQRSGRWCHGKALLDVLSGK
jgi:hypothetical protein